MQLERNFRLQKTTPFKLSTEKTPEACLREALCLALFPNSGNGDSLEDMLNAIDEDGNIDCPCCKAAKSILLRPLLDADSIQILKTSGARATGEPCGLNQSSRACAISSSVNPDSSFENMGFKSFLMASSAVICHFQQPSDFWGKGAGLFVYLPSQSLMICIDFRKFRFECLSFCEYLLHIPSLLLLVSVVEDSDAQSSWLPNCTTNPFLCPRFLRERLCSPFQFTQPTACSIPGVAFFRSSRFMQGWNSRLALKARNQGSTAGICDGSLRSRWSRKSGPRLSR